MKGFFDNILNLESPTMIKASRLGNLIVLNLLWLLCCLPIVTIGPATIAMNYVIFQYHTERSDVVLRPFFKSFRRDFRQGLMLGIPLTLLFCLMVFNGVYITAASAERISPLWISFALLVLFLGALITYGFPLLARYDLTMSAVINNSLVFFLRNPKLSFSAMLLHYLPVVLILFLPDIFIKVSFLYVLLGGSAVAYVNNRALLKIFDASQAEADAAAEEAAREEAPQSE